MSDPLAFEKSLPPPPERRKVLAELVLKIIRDARFAQREPTVAEVLSAAILRAETEIGFLQARLGQCVLFPTDAEEPQADFEFWAGLVDRFSKPDEDVQAYISLRLQWDYMTVVEQGRIRHKSRVGEVVPMTERPPSIDQMQYLRTIGYRGADPLTMAEASMLINEFRARRARNRV